MTTIDDLTKLVDEATHVCRQPFIISTSIFLAFAFLTAVLHFYLRFPQVTIPLRNDFTLLTSILCLVGSTAAIHLGLSDIYLANAITANPSLIPSPPPSDIVDIAASALRYMAAFHSLIWTAIFAVKVSLLCFFKQFVDVLAASNNKVLAYWWGVMALTVGGWAFMLAEPSIACPHRGGEAAIKCTTSSALSYSTAVLDCLTTLFVLSYPFLLLRNRRTHTTPGQKAAFATLSTLSFATIILALVRSPIHKSDTPFQAQLTYLEACLAVATVSLTAHKHYFAYAHPPEHQPEGTQLRWRPGTLTARKRTRTESLERLHRGAASPLPEHVMPGLSTFIEGGTIRTPSRLTKTSLRRQESVLRTREVVVEVHYEKDVEKGNWDRVGSPSWMDEKWKMRRSSESSDSGS